MSTRWGVFAREPAVSPDWAEIFRWDGNELVPLPDAVSARERAADLAGQHPEWDVEARQTDVPLPGTFRESFADLLPGPGLLRLFPPPDGPEARHDR
jgi:hypothetical protein